MNAGFDDAAANFRTSDYCMDVAEWACRRCLLNMAIYALVLPVTHEARYVDDDESDESDSDGRWEMAELPVRLFYVGYLSPQARLRIGQLAPHYWLDWDDEMGIAYFMNHCSECGAGQGDREIHEEYPSAFDLSNRRTSETSRVVPLHEPLAAHAAGFAIDAWRFPMAGDRARVKAG